MPKIIQYQPDQVTTQVANQSGALQAPAGAFNNPVVGGAINLVQAGLQMKQQIDTTAAEEAAVSFEREKNDIFFNPESGYFNTQGKNAYDNSAIVIKTLDDLKRKYGENLSQEARVAFDKVADAHITKSRTDISRHAAKGLKAWEVSTIESQVENSIENASLYWNSPEDLKVQNVLGRQAIIDSAELMGLSPESTNEKLQTFDSSFARSAIEAATQVSAGSGKEALDQYGDKLEGPYKVKMESLIEKKQEQEKTENDARAAVLTATRLVDQYDSRQGIIDEVNTIEDPELRKKTMTESMAQLSRKRQAEKEQEQEHYNTSIGYVNSGMTPSQIQAKDSEAWLGMNDLQRNNILSGKHTVTDQILLAQLRSLPVKDKAKITPIDYSDKLRPADLQKLTTEVEAAKKGKPGSRVRSLSSKSIAAAEGAYGKKAKWTIKSGKQTEKGKEANEFLNDLQDALDEFSDQNNGRKATPAEEDQIISEFTRNILVERSTMGIDWLAPDLELDLSNTPPKDLRVLNRIINSTPGIDPLELISAYRLLTTETTIPVTAQILYEVYKQGTQ